MGTGGRLSSLLTPADLQELLEVDGSLCMSPLWAIQVKPSQSFHGSGDRTPLCAFQGFPGKASVKRVLCAIGGRCGHSVTQILQPFPT